MEQETMDLEQLATYLRRDVREVSKMASRGYLPGQKVGGQWRFVSSEINYWLERQLPEYGEEELARLDAGGRAKSGLLITQFLSENTMAVPLAAGTKASVLKELVRLAEQSWQVYDPDALLDAVKLREDMGSTAVYGGVAIPHPHRPLPLVVGDTVIAFGRTATPIPFGGTSGACDLFFLVCCRQHRTHVNILARLSRLFLRPNFLDDLRAAHTTAEAWQVIEKAERELVEG